MRADVARESSNLLLVKGMYPSGSCGDQLKDAREDGCRCPKQ